MSSQEPVSDPRLIIEAVQNVKDGLFWTLATRYIQRRIGATMAVLVRERDVQQVRRLQAEATAWKELLLLPDLLLRTANEQLKETEDAG